MFCSNRPSELLESVYACAEQTTLLWLVRLMPSERTSWTGTVGGNGFLLAKIAGTPDTRKSGSLGMNLNSFSFLVSSF
jgi:hypothetical protein